MVLLKEPPTNAVVVSAFWSESPWTGTRSVLIQSMRFMTDRYREVLHTTFSTLKLQVNGPDVNLLKDWEEWDYVQVNKDCCGVDSMDNPIEQIKETLEDNTLKVGEAKMTIHPGLSL